MNTLSSDFGHGERTDIGSDEGSGSRVDPSDFELFNFGPGERRAMESDGEIRSGVALSDFDHFNVDPGERTTIESDGESRSRVPQSQRPDFLNIIGSRRGCGSKVSDSKSPEHDEQPTIGSDGESRFRVPVGAVFGPFNVGPLPGYPTEGEDIRQLTRIDFSPVMAPFFVLITHENIDITTAMHGNSRGVQWETRYDSRFSYFERIELETLNMIFFLF